MAETRTALRHILPLDRPPAEPVRRTAPVWRRSPPREDTSCTGNCGVPTEGRLEGTARRAAAIYRTAPIHFRRPWMPLGSIPDRRTFRRLLLAFADGPGRSQ